MVDCTFSEGARLPKSEHNCLLLKILTSIAECADLSDLSGLAAPLNFFFITAARSSKRLQQGRPLVFEKSFGLGFRLAG